MIEGLPPGPIANPGRASIEAAANPARTKELFFVADGTGGHTFSETYDQHQKGVAKLRGIEKDAPMPPSRCTASPRAAPAARCRGASLPHLPPIRPQPRQPGPPIRRCQRRTGAAAAIRRQQQPGTARSQNAPPPGNPRTQ